MEERQIPRKRQRQRSKHIDRKRDLFFFGGGGGGGE